MALVGGARRSLSVAEGLRWFSSSPAARAAVQKAPIQLHGLEGRYAHALFSAAASKNCLKEVEDDLMKLNLQRGTPFADYLFNPAEQRSTKLRVLDDALKEAKFNEVTRGFLRTVTEMNRVRKFRGMVEGYQKLMSATRGEVSCVVTTASKPDQKTLDQVKTILTGMIKPNEKIIMDVKVDPKIIGGMVVQVGDRFCDMSVATKVRRLTDSLQAAV